MTWGLHDSIEMEKRGRPAVTVITAAFTVAAGARAKVLGMADHPRVVVEHPFINQSAAEVRSRAERVAGEIASGLVRR